MLAIFNIVTVDAPRCFPPALSTGDWGSYSMTIFMGGMLRGKGESAQERLRT